MAIRVYGDKEAIKKLRSLDDKKLCKHFEPALLQISEKIKQNAQRNLRNNGSYVTGALHDSIKAKNTQTKRKGVYRSIAFADFPNIKKYSGKSNYRGARHARHGKRVYYALHVEFGTKHNKAKPFLIPAGNDTAVYKYGKLLMEQAMEEAIK